MSQVEGSGYGNHLTLNRAQFSKSLLLILNKGTSAEVRDNQLCYLSVTFHTLLMDEHKNKFQIELKSVC